MEPVFCTLFDTNYAAKGLSMIRSIDRHCSRKDYEIHVLCLDDFVAAKLIRLWHTNVNVWSLQALESADPGLLAVKTDRTWQEYCWTLGSRFSRYIMENVSPPSLTYVDADMFFFDDPMRALDMAGAASIAATPHNFPAADEKRLIVNGKFCVSWVSWRRDDAGLACLKRWSDQVLGWCHYRHENGKFADQKYLDEWPDMYGSDFIELIAPPVWPAPWNLHAHPVNIGPTVDDVKMMAYHFHELRETSPGMFFRTGYPVTREQAEYVYKPYEAAYLEAKKEIGL